MKTNYEKGGALLVTIVIIMSMVLASAVAMVRWSRNNYKCSVRETENSRAFYIADSGVQYALKRIISDASTSVLDLNEISNNFMSIVNSLVSSNEFQISKFTLVETSTNGVNPFGINEIFILEKLYEVTCQVTNLNNKVPGNYAEVSCQLGDFSVSLFKFGLYYQNMEMEIYPGSKEMRIGGRTHSNKGIYLGPQNCVRFLGPVTSADGIYHGGIPGKDVGWGTRTGHIYIPPEEVKPGYTYNYKDVDGDGVKEVFFDMRTNKYYYWATNKWNRRIYKKWTADYIDSYDPEWALKAEETWGKNARTVDHDISSIQLPFENSLDDTRVLIDPDPRTNEAYEITKCRFENKAGLVLTPEGDLYEQTGEITNAEYTTRVFIDNITNLNWVITTNQFFNRRNMGYYTNDPNLGVVKPTDIDIEEFSDWLDTQPSLSFKDSSSDRAGIFYIHRSNTLGRAVRLFNGEELYDTSAGLTIATPNPMYTWGDYNTKINGSSGTNRPALILSDTITALSVDWEDEDNQIWPANVLNPKVHPKPSYYCTPADDTTVNSAIFSGSAEPQANEFQATGGVQNYIRYLEYWGGCKFEANGSIACLWTAEQEWQTKNSGRNEIKPKYRKFPSYRYFLYDESLDKRPPPGFDNFYTYSILNWKRVH